MQRGEWQDPASGMNEMQWVLKKIADFEALWRTSQELIQRCSKSRCVSPSEETFRPKTPDTTQGEEKAA